MRCSTRLCKQLIKHSLKVHFVVLGFVLVCYIYVYKLVTLQSDVARQLNFIQVQMAIGQFGNVIYHTNPNENQTSYKQMSGPYFDVRRVARSIPNETKSNTVSKKTSDTKTVHTPDTVDAFVDSGDDFGNEEVNSINSDEINKGYLYDDEEHTKNTSVKSKARLLFFKRLVAEQVKLYKRPVVKRAKAADVFYLSAIASEEGESESKMIKLNGWQGPNYKYGKLYCCAKGYERKAMHAAVANRVRWTTTDIHIVYAVKFVCNMSQAISPIPDFPEAIGLNRSPLCINTEYVKVERVEKASSKNRFAVCAKIIYGSIDAKNLFEWFEVNRRMGVDRVHLFTYNVTETVNTLLNFYKTEGLLTTSEFDFPLKMRYPRYLGQKYVMSYIDEQVPVFDCVERHKNYETVALIDVDEVIVPRYMGVNYTQLMTNLNKEFKHSAGFMMQTRLFVLDWEPDYPNADFRFGAYTKRTKSMWDRCKNIFMPSRVYLDSVWTHGYKPLKGYKQTRVSYVKASLYHYRQCRSHWYTQNTCLQNRARYSDVTLKRYIGTFRDSLLQRRKMIFKDSTAPKRIH